MGKPCRGIRANWTSEMMEEALQLLQQGLSQREVERRSGIPRRTLRAHMQSGSTERSLGRKPILSKQQEEDLENRIIRLAEVGMPLTPKSLRRNIYSFIKANRINLKKKKNNQILGKDWFSAFQKRHPRLSKRRAQCMNPARTQKLNRFIVNDYFRKLRFTLEKNKMLHTPERIFNMDEKGCRLTLHHQQSVLVLKRTKRVHLVAQEHAENSTVVACVNALGNAIPPMILFKGIRQKPTFQDGLPAGSAVLMSPKGSMTTKLFCKWLEHFAKYKPTGKVLLIFDGATSNLDMMVAQKAEELEIPLFCLPSNTTHELQPLDRAVFRSFEHFWDEELMTYWDQTPDRKLTKDRFSHIFTPVWEKCMSVANITSGFRVTGIYPFNPRAIPDVAYAPSSVCRPVENQTSSTSLLTSPAVGNQESCSSDDDANIPLAVLRTRLMGNITRKRAEDLPGPSKSNEKNAFSNILKTPELPEKKVY
ncbi:tigger transposable element-derived protein 1-like [Onthophagus taurus]|uniref:tigger transposable element-derived protein 1-like n=1 Tax=Onthophagus taurus TaxID=166361 RepID=UPI0039BDB0B7